MAIFKSTRRLDIADGLRRAVERYNILIERIVRPPSKKVKIYRLSGLGEYTGVRASMGGGIIDNTSLAVDQFLVVLSLAEHPDLERLANGSVDLSLLVHSKVLKGIKILDLGCGVMPTFARICRALGAEVYTVDVKSSNKFVSKRASGGFDREAREVEKRHHIRVNLREADACKRIVEISGGTFDIVTEAHLCTDDPGIDGGFLRTAIGELLAPSGVFYSAPDDDRIRVKDGDRYLTYRIVPDPIGSLDSAMACDAFISECYTRSDLWAFTSTGRYDRDIFTLELGQGFSLEENGRSHIIYLLGLDHDHQQTGLLVASTYDDCLDHRWLNHLD